jgi:hypothetical protein
MRRTAELFDNFVQRTTMQMAGGDKDLDNLTGHRAHDGLALDLRANARGRCDNDARRPREQDFIAHLQHGGGVRLHVPVTPQDALNDSAPTNLCLDCSDRSARRRCDPIGPGLKFSIEELTGVLGISAGERGLQFGSFLL